MGVFQEDIQNVAQSDLINWSSFANHSILITGSTGLIGSMTTRVFLYRNKRYKDNIRLILPVRDIEKAKSMLSEEECGQVRFYQTAVENLQQVDEAADYLIHCAAPTQSSFFVNSPVETMESILFGMQAVANYARRCSCKGAVWLSSMEAFGDNDKPLLSENDIGTLPLSSLRSSYPQAKRTAELLAYAYSKEYSVPIKTVRLAQTFGPGVSLSDGRVFMQFCKAICAGKDIILQTTGESVSNYCYTSDAILGILKVLLDGKNGETYTLVNDDHGITIRGIAEWLLETYGGSGQKIVYDLTQQGRYAAINRSNLSNEKAKRLGWSPVYSIKMGYERLLDYMKEGESDL